MLIVVLTDRVEPEQRSCSRIGALDWMIQAPGPCSGTSLEAPGVERSPTSAPLAAPTISGEATGGAVAPVEITDGESGFTAVIALDVVETVVVGSVVEVGLTVVDVATVDVDVARGAVVTSRWVVPRDRATSFGGLETVKTSTSSRIGLDQRTRCAARSEVTRSIMNPRYRGARTVAKPGEVMIAHTRNR